MPNLYREIIVVQRLIIGASQRMSKSLDVLTTLSDVQISELQGRIYKEMSRRRKIALKATRKAPPRRKTTIPKKTSKKKHWA